MGARPTRVAGAVGRDGGRPRAKKDITSAPVHEGAVAEVTAPVRAVARRASAETAGARGGCESARGRFFPVERTVTPVGGFTGGGVSPAKADP